MSCIYKYKGKDYTKDEFYSLVRTTMVQPRTVQKYTKILFPSGNTASKVEGHTTLEEFKKQKEDRIKELENRKKQFAYSTIEASTIFTSRISSSLQESYNEELRDKAKEVEGKYIVVDKSIDSSGRSFGVNLPQNLQGITIYQSKEAAEKAAQSEGTYEDNEINQLKQELERVETEGFGALKPIYNFYENTVTNILNKTYGKENINKITDEYGNGWYELQLKNNINTPIDLLPLSDTQSQNVINSFKNTILIPNLSPLHQQNLINNLSFMLYREILTNGKINDKNVFNNFENYIKELINVSTGKRKELLQSVIDNYPSVKNMTRVYFSKLQGVTLKLNVDNIIEESDLNTNNELNEEEIDESGNFEKNSFEDDATLSINYKKTASARVKKFLAFLPDGNLDFTYSPTYISYDEAYNTIKNLVSGEKPNFDNMIKVLESNISSKPWLREAVTQLKNANGELKNDFVTSMTGHTVNMTFLAWGKSDEFGYSLVPIDANRNSISNVIKQDWYENAKTIGLLKLKEDEEGLYYDHSTASKFEIQVNNLKDKKINEITIDDLEKTFISIGFILEKGTLAEILSKGIDRKGLSYHLNLKNSESIFGNIMSKLYSTNDVVTDNYLSSNIVSKLAFLDTKYTANKNDNSFRAGTKLISNYTLNKFLTNHITELKNNRKLLTDTLNISFSSGNELLKSFIFTEITEDVKNEAEKITGSPEVTLKNGIVYASDGQVLYNTESYSYNNFGLNYLSLEALKEFGKPSKDNRELGELSAAEHELIKVGLFMKSVLNTDKKGNRVAQMFYPTTSDKTTTFLINTLLHNTSFTPDETLSNSTVDALFDALVKPEIKRMLDYKPTNISGYDEGSNIFYFLPELNNKLELFENGKLDENVLVNENSLKIIKDEIRNTITNLTQSKLTEWASYKFDKTTFLDSKYMSKTVKFNIEHAATDYVVNYLIHNSNMFQSFIGDPALYYKISDDELKNKLKNKEELSDTDRIQKVKDTFINIGKRLAGDIAPGYELNNSETDFYKFAVLADNKSTSESIIYYRKLLGEKGAKPYEKIEAGDAQEYTTLAEHLDVMYLLGKITEKDYNRIKDLALKKETLNDNDISLILQPMKPVYVANKIELHNNVIRRVYIKSSSFPLIPQLTKGLQIDNLREAMEKQNIDRVAFGSAVKVGSPTNQLNIFDNKGNILNNIDFTNTEILTLNRSGFRIQQEIPYDKDKVNVGTQERKLLFVNLLDTPGFIYDRTEPYTGKELQQIYTEKYGELFKNQQLALFKELEYNPETKKINTEKLQKVLKKEALERDYPINDILGLELNSDGKFKIPLWLLPSATRYESLLNAIIDNRIRKMKFNGSSFVLGSEEGFKTKTEIIDDVNEANSKIKEYDSEIIFTESWTGKLLSTRETGLTQAIVPFKFRDKNGKLLNIKDYITTKDGKSVLNYDKLPKDLLKIFGFRIPTQGLNSMAQIEIVGFLPESAGDLIITSKDFTQQMGSDFDIDKLYGYMYSHFTDSFGTINKVTKQNINKLLDLSQFKDNIKEDLSKWISKLYDALEIEYTDEDLKDKDLSKLKSKLEQLATHNDLLDIHFSVMNNPHENVQKQILTPLGFGDLKGGKDLANLISKWKELRNTSQQFNGLSDSYQKQKYINALAGKSGIGVFSLDSVFNVLAQGKDLHYKIFSEGENIFEVRFGNLKSNGYLSDEYTLESRMLLDSVEGDIKKLSDTNKKKLKYKSDVIAAFQSAAVDNEKEQILDKLNINNLTYDTIRILAQLGFDESAIVSIISQDIISEYVTELNNGKSSLYRYNPNLESDIISRLRKKYELLANEKEYPLSNDFAELINKQQNASVEELLSYIKDGDKSNTIGYAATQIAVLIKFKELTEYGKSLKRIQSAINTDSSGIGKSLFASISKEESVRGLKQSPIENAEKLIGDYNYIDGELVITPTTINGYATVYGLFTNNEIWKNYFPYQEENIQDIVNTVIKHTSDKNLDTSQKEKVYRDVFNDIKSYLFSREDLGIFEGSLFENRTRLFKDLGTSILFMKENNNKLFKTNPFLTSLQVEKDLDSGLNIVKYNASSMESFFENSIYAGFLELIEKDVEFFNGYTTRQLADDFVKYAYLSGGKQQAVDFIRYIPIEYLNQLPFASKLNNLNFKDTNVLGNIIKTDKTSPYIVPEFVKQYIQHHSNKVTELSKTTKVEYVNKGNISKFTIENKNNPFSKNPLFLTFKNNLYQYNGKEYQQISKLGGKYGFSEYDANNENISSIIDNNNYKSIKLSNVPEITSNTIVNKNAEEDLLIARNSKYALNSNSVIKVLEAITDHSTSKEYKVLAQEYIDVINRLNFKITFESDSNLEARGRTTYNQENAHITINSSNKIKTIKDLELTILHEVTHALTKNIIISDESKLTSEQLRIRTKLETFHKLFKERIGQDKIDTVLKKIAERTNLSDKELYLIYAGKNLEEFIAAAMNHPEFQEFMASEIWKGDKTMLDKLFELLQDLIKSLGINIGEDLNPILNREILSLIKTQIITDTVQSENISSKGSEFAKKLTNVGNTVGLTYKGKEYVNSEHAYQTWKSGEFNQKGYDLKGGKVRGGKIATGNYTDYTNYSGAAQGGDTVWENVGKEFGLGKQVNYRPEDLQKLTKEQLEEVENAYLKAVKDLGRGVLAKNTFAGGLVRRDYLQAKAADSVFAISTIIEPGQKDKKGYINKTNKQVVEGGTGYAVQMAINLGKPVFVFDQLKNKWFSWDKTSNSFEETSTPKLTKKFAGIGTREINDLGKQAIRDVYEQSKEDTFSIMTDILTEKLKQHPELVQGINERGGLAYIEQSTHNVIGDKFWESTGQNKFIEALTQAYKNVISNENTNNKKINTEDLLPVNKNFNTDNSLITNNSVSLQNEDWTKIPNNCGI